MPKTDTTVAAVAFFIAFASCTANAETWPQFRGVNGSARSRSDQKLPDRIDPQASVEWEFTKFVPFIASPVFVNGYVFTVKDGGILTSLDAKTGKPIKTRRVTGTGTYYSSPVAGGGKVYLINQEGQLSVVSAEGDWQILSSAEFGEEVYATPAIVDGNIYLRTTGHLYSFALAEK